MAQQYILLEGSSPSQATFINSYVAPTLLTPGALQHTHLVMAHPDLQFHAQDKRYASKAEYLKSSEDQALALEGSVPRAERPDEKLEGDAQTLASPTPLNLLRLGGCRVPAGAEETLPHSRGCDSRTSAPASHGRPAGDTEAQGRGVF